MGKTRSRSVRKGKGKGTGPKQVAWYVVVLRAVVALLALAGLGVFGYWAYRFTLMPIHDRGQAVGNTHPGHTLRFYLDQPSIKEAVRQLGGNLVLLAPLGVLLPLASVRLRGFVRLTLVVALISLGIEICQGKLVEGRAFDADDVILNTAGALLAYLLIGRRLSRLLRGRDRR